MRTQGLPVVGMIALSLAAPLGCTNPSKSEEGENITNVRIAASGAARNDVGEKEELLREGALYAEGKGMAPAPAATADYGSLGGKAGRGSVPGYGNGASGLGQDSNKGRPQREAAPQQKPQSAESPTVAKQELKTKSFAPPSTVPVAPPPPTPVAPTPPPAAEDAPIDPNGRFATTYRPGGGHLAAFESAMTAGLIPQTEQELVSDIGSRYLPDIPLPTKGALSFQADFERTKLAPTGGPVHLRFSIRSSEVAAKERPPLSVVVVLDVSGSMRGELISSARKAASQLLGRLEDSDEFGLVTFSTDANTLVPLGRIGSGREKIQQTISQIVEGGGTNISGGLSAGYSELAKTRTADAVRVAMLLSDGRANNGITARSKLSQLALNAFQEGIQTSAFGLGTDYDGPLMSQLAGDGAGGYYFLKDGSQIESALATELSKRLDPVATALEVRVRLKPEVEVLKVYGSRKLSEQETARVRAIEVATDLQEEKRTKIKANRQEDLEGGMRFFIPAFARADAHSMLLKLRLPEGIKSRDIATIEVKYKDRLTKKNVLEEIPLKLDYADSDLASAKSIDPAVVRSVQGFLAGETLMQAAQLMAKNDKQAAIDLLGQREGLLQHAAVTLGEPLFVQDSRRLSRLREHASAKSSLSDPLVLAMMMETAGSVHLH